MVLMLGPNSNLSIIYNLSLAYREVYCGIGLIFDLFYGVNILCRYIFCNPRVLFMFLQLPILPPFIEANGFCLEPT